MQRAEFAAAMAVLTAAIARPMAEDQATVYFELLGDLPADVLKLAIKRTLLEHRITTIPTIAELRALATEIMHPESAMDSGQAFGLARQAIAGFGWSSQEPGLASLPPLVRQVVRQIGWRVMCESENADAMRAHFVRMFEAARSSVVRTLNQPVALRNEIRERQALPSGAAPTIQDVVSKTAARMKGIN